MDLPGIFDAITAAFETDPLLDEFGVVLSMGSEEVQSGPKSFVLHVEHKLGLLYSAVKPLFQYSLKKFDDILKLVKLHESSIALSDKSKVSDQGERVILIDLKQQLLACSRVVLLIRGDFPKAFSVRKGITLSSCIISIIIKFIFF